MSLVPVGLLPEDQWVAIQHKTFVNWVNEQLSIGNRSVANLATDLSDGVKLVALVEALQFRKIGKVYAKPSSRIQMLNNVSLAIQAIADDHVRLVNIGNDDIVGGNLKLILGLLWHLIIRYQISSSKTKAPPKRLMLAWFKNAISSLGISNFTSDWRNGIALHALVDHCKPGLSPKWKDLSPNNGEENCRRAMQLAKDHLGVPRVITPEDFASPDLDELSAMTYLSYFIRKDSPGYYSTLNWVCRQLKTTNISNLTTDWNDGYLLCSLCDSMGGDVPGWPHLNRSDHLANCQNGIQSAKSLGVEPLISATELSDPHVDHLTVMSYLSQFQSIKPLKGKAERVITKDLEQKLAGLIPGQAVSFDIETADVQAKADKVSVTVKSSSTTPNCQISGNGKLLTCSFSPGELGSHQISIQYDGVEIRGSPFTFHVGRDVSDICISGTPSPCKIGRPFTVHVLCSADTRKSVQVRVIDSTGGTRTLSTEETATGLTATLSPNFKGTWTYEVTVDREVVKSSTFQVYDLDKISLHGGESCMVGEKMTLSVKSGGCPMDHLQYRVDQSDGSRLSNVIVAPSGDGNLELSFVPTLAGVLSVRVSACGEMTDTPKFIKVVDPSHVELTGDGLIRCNKGVEASFIVDKKDLSGEISVEMKEPGDGIQLATLPKEILGDGKCRFTYLPSQVGSYVINVLWDRKHLLGSPFTVPSTDKSQVTVMADLEELKDEKDRIALTFEHPTVLDFDTSNAGPGRFKVEVLSPEGKLPVDIRQHPEKVSVSFSAICEGEHYIHLFWSETPLEFSPLLAYCPGPSLPIDVTKVAICGKGAEVSRVNVETDFMIDGRKAGPGVAKVRLKGAHTNVPVHIKPLKYDRYMCRFACSDPGSYLLYVYWSDDLLPGCPLKVNVTPKGHLERVKVKGEGLGGGITGQEWEVEVETKEAGAGEVTADCFNPRHDKTVCEVTEDGEGQYVIRSLPTEPGKYTLHLKFDGEHVNGSPFTIRVSEPPDASKVKVFGPGIEDGLVDDFESRFLVDTRGAGTGQLAIKIRGPKGGFKVDMRRETKRERTINCRYDPREPGEYIIYVRWSNVHVPGSPFSVHLVDTRQELDRLIRERGFIPRDQQLGWRAEI